MNFKNLRTNFISVFSKIDYIIVFSVLCVLFFLFFYSQTHNDLIAGNYGHTYLMWQWIIQVVLTIQLSLFITISAYKVFYFSSFDVKENGAGAFATFFGILAAGCPACSITIASYIGLAGFLSLFPYGGLELKILSVFILIIAIIYILKDLHICQIKKKKPEKSKNLEDGGEI